MPSKKSDTPGDFLTDTAPPPAAPLPGTRPSTGLVEPADAPAAGAVAAVTTTTPPSALAAALDQSTGRYWPRTILGNLWIPLAIAAMYPLALLLENPDYFNAYYLDILLNVCIYVILALSLQLINGISGQFSLGHAGFMAVGAYLAAFATKTFGSVGTGDAVVNFANPGRVLMYFIALVIPLCIAGALLVLLFLAIRRLRDAHASLPGIAMLLIFIWIVGDVALANSQATIPFYLIWSQGVHQLTHLFNWLLTLGPYLERPFDHLSLGARQPLTLLIALIGGGIMAAIAGLVVGLPTLRLRGDYLAIATLGFGEIIRIGIVTTDALGGATGLHDIPQYSSQQQHRYLFPWIAGAVILTFIIIWRLAHSAKGRSLAAVREDEVAAAAIGIDPTQYKVLAFIIGAFFAGVAGALYAHKDGYLYSDSYGFLKSVEIVVMVTIGGLGSLWGATIAAVLLTLLPQVLDNADRFLPPSLAEPAHWTSANRTVIYAVLLVVVVIIRARWRDILRSSTASYAAARSWAGKIGTGASQD